MMKKAAGRLSRWTVPLSKTTVLSITVPSNILPVPPVSKSQIIVAIRLKIRLLAAFKQLFMYLDVREKIA